MQQVPLVIAEAGVNHNGDLARAVAMVEAAAAAGADIVKFQAFTASDLVAAGTQTAAYQKANTGLTDQKAMLEQLALSLDSFATLAEACHKNRIEFLCTAFAVDMARDLVNLGMRRVKIASGELTNVPGLQSFARLGLPIILSTGMASLAEVEQALSVLRQSGATDITVLHCTSLYPAPEESINLRAMCTMRERLRVPVGYSDHSMGDHVAIAAVALGACVIEKHFTLDRNLPGPDHSASLESGELATFVKKLRATAAALGDGIKQAHPLETDTARLVRRSWRATRPLTSGQVIAEGDVALKRPADGLPPHISPIGKTLRQALSADAAIRAEDLA